MLFPVEVAAEADLPEGCLLLGRDWRWEESVELGDLGREVLQPLQWRLAFLADGLIYGVLEAPRKRRVVKSELLIQVVFEALRAEVLGVFG